MEKIVVCEEGAKRVSLRVDLHRVFSEDFKRIVRSAMLVKLIGAYEANKLNPTDEDPDPTKLPLDEITKKALSTVLTALPLMLDDCLEGLKDYDTYKEEMKDLGFNPPEDVEDDTKKTDE